MIQVQLEFRKATT